MNTLQSEMARATRVFFQNDRLYVHLSDEREISVPLAWFPRLLYATEEQRQNWELLGQGVGIHWETVDEDISVAGLLGWKAD
ncbi:MAG: DUF2442 domain-containing protein [Chloroflexi bacterium]|nr:DUF2442 domain-containing protein [Chloroflexota bacterium]